MIKQCTIAWLVGYFVCLVPIFYIISVPPFEALTMGILGVGGALIIEKLERRWNYD